MKILKRLSPFTRTQKKLFKALLKSRFFLWFVFVPNLIFLVYMVIFEAKRYEVYAEIILKSTAKQNVAETMFPFAINSSKNNELEMIRRFIFSYSLLSQLDSEFKLKEYYQTMQGIDLFSYYRGSNIQHFLDYFEKKISVEIDKENSIMKIEFNDYSSEKAFEILNRILILSEEFINRSEEDLLKKQIEIAETAAKKVMEQIRVLREVISTKQVKFNIASPRIEFENLNATILVLEADLLKQQSSLAEMEAYLNPKSIQIITAKQKIKNINNKLADLKKKLIVKDKVGGEFLTVDFGALEVEMELLIQEYKVTLGLFEQAKLSILSNTEHVIVITEPFVTDYAKYPRILYHFLLSLFITLGLYIVIKAIFGIIKEHEGF